MIGRNSGIRSIGERTHRPAKATASLARRGTLGSRRNRLAVVTQVGRNPASSFKTPPGSRAAKTTISAQVNARTAIAMTMSRSTGSIVAPMIGQLALTRAGLPERTPLGTPAIPIVPGVRCRSSVPPPIGYSRRLRDDTACATTSYWLSTGTSSPLCTSRMKSPTCGWGGNSGHDSTEDSPEQHSVLVPQRDRER